MNSNQSMTRTIPALATFEGAGVTVHRSIGSPALRNYDPFMLLDFFGSDDPDEYIAGFPDHPHRGFSTFTYMLDGHMEHRDSMGNTGRLEPGSAQLMKAASGVIHSEMPKQENGLMRGFQLWINLPAANKMDHPAYQEYAANEFPVLQQQGSRIKVLIGSYGDTQSPIHDDITEVGYVDVQVDPGQAFRHALPAHHNSFLFLFEGSGKLGQRALASNTLATLGEEDHNLDFHAGEQGARFILVSGKPINESIVQYGPFVMNSREEIDQAMHDFHNNNLVRDRAWMNRS